MATLDICPLKTLLKWFKAWKYNYRHLKLDQNWFMSKNLMFDNIYINQLILIIFGAFQSSLFAKKLRYNFLEASYARKYWPEKYDAYFNWNLK